jgi:hypothetical protein
MTESEVLQEAAGRMDDALEALRDVRRLLERTGCQLECGQVRGAILAVNGLPGRLSAEARRRRPPRALSPASLHAVGPATEQGRAETG